MFFVYKILTFYHVIYTIAIEETARWKLQYEPQK